MERMPEGDTVWNTARVLHSALAGAAIWLGIASFLVAAIIGGLAYSSRDRSPRVT